MRAAVIWPATSTHSSEGCIKPCKVQSLRGGSVDGQTLPNFLPQPTWLILWYRWINASFKMVITIIFAIFFCAVCSITPALSFMVLCDPSKKENWDSGNYIRMPLHTLGLGFTIWRIFILITCLQCSRQKFRFQEYVHFHIILCTVWILV